MPTVREQPVRAFASCQDARCRGYRQVEVDAVREDVEITFRDNGGDMSGVERSFARFRFADPDEAPCGACGGSRIVDEQKRPVYPAQIGQQDYLLKLIEEGKITLGDGGSDDRLVELERQNRELMAKLEALSERIEAPVKRGPGRPRKDEPVDG